MPLPRMGIRCVGTHSLWNVQWSEHSLAPPSQGRHTRHPMGDNGVAIEVGTPSHY